MIQPRLTLAAHLFVMANAYTDADAYAFRSAGDDDALPARGDGRNFLLGFAGGYWGDAAVCMVVHPAEPVASSPVVNSDKGLVMSWRTENKTRVEVGQPLIDIETSKALIEVDAAHAGFILQAVNAGHLVAARHHPGRLFEGRLYISYS